MFVAAVGVLYGIVFALNLLSLLALPRLSLLLDVSPTGGTRVSWVLPGGVLWQSGVRPGALVLALDDRAPRADQGGAWSGSRVTVRAQTGHTVVVDAHTIQDNAAWPLLALSPWFLLLGTLLVLRAPSRCGARRLCPFRQRRFYARACPGGGRR